MNRFVFLVFLFLSNLTYSQDIVDVINSENNFYILYSDSTWNKINNTDKINLERSKKYINRYNLNCLNDKLVDNRGEGYDSLYGTRNFRPILHGIAYRGGANNYYHKQNKRNNKNPMPIDGLENLTEEGFSKVMYLYTTNFDYSKNIYSFNQDQISYVQNDLEDIDEINDMISDVYDVMLDSSLGPLYLHCWNGWHQSGYVSAILLMQFCDFTNQMALDYWNACAAPWNVGYVKIKQKILDYKISDKFPISQMTKKSICPCIDYMQSDFEYDESEVLNLRKVINTSIQFPINSQNLTPGNLAILDSYVEILKLYKFINIEISGHTSTVGDDDINMDLSVKRAKMIYDYFVKNGVESSQLDYQGYGETKVLDESNTTEAHKINRRVDFKLKSFNFQIGFPKNGFEIPNEAKKDLLVIKEFISQNPDIKIEISGHTDSSGNSDYNLNLSSARANTIYQFFKGFDLNMDNIYSKGYGDSKPLYDNNTEDGRNKNRRIEIKIIE